MTALRTLLEDAVVAQLAGLLSTAPGGYLRRIAVCEADLDAEELAPEVLRLVEGQAPSVYVQAGDGSDGEHSLEGRIATETLTLHLLIVSRNLRSAEARARGDGINPDPGVWQIDDDLRRYLAGVIVTSTSRPLVPASLRKLGITGAWSAYMRDYTAYLDHDVGELPPTDPDYAAANLDGADIDVNLYDADGDEVAVINPAIERDMPL